MRIVVVTCHQELVGGVETYLQRMLPALVAAGHEVLLLTELVARPGHATVHDGLALSGHLCLAHEGVPAALARVAKFDPDVILQNGLRGSEVEAQLLELAPAVLFAHGYHGMCATGTRLNVRPVTQPCARRFDAGCLVQNYVRGCGIRRPGVLLETYRMQRARRAMLPQYRAVLSASGYMRDQLLAHGVRASDAFVLPMPSSGSARPRKLRESTSPPTLLFAGRITELKGLQYLLRALPSVSHSLGQPVSLTVAGDGPYRPVAQSEAEALGLRVSFLGWVDDSERGDLLNAADLLVVPSVWPEPFGMVGIEAAAAGVPAAAFDVGGVREWLEPGVSGELADGTPPTSNGLASAIVRALRTPAHHASLCEGAARSAVRFTASAHVDALTGVLREVTSAAAGVP